MFIQTIKCELSRLCFRNDVLVYVIRAHTALARLSLHWSGIGVQHQRSELALAFLSPGAENATQCR